MRTRAKEKYRPRDQGRVGVAQWLLQCSQLKSAALLSLSSLKSITDSNITANNVIITSDWAGTMAWRDNGLAVAAKASLGSTGSAAAEAAVVLADEVVEQAGNDTGKQIKSCRQWSVQCQ